MKYFYCISTVLVLLFSVNEVCFAQSYIDAQNQLFTNLTSLQKNKHNIDSLTFYTKNTQSLLDSIYCENSILKNGKFYNNYFRIKGSPFLFKSKPKISQITINSKTINTDKLNYDIYSDQLVFEVVYENKIIKTILNETIVEKFTINDKNFINCNNAGNGLIKYHELIYEGATFLLLAKWKKGKVSATQVNESDSFSGTQRSLFLINENNLAQIRNSKDIFRFFNTIKSDRKKFKKTSPKRLSKANSEELKIFISQFDL